MVRFRSPLPLGASTTSIRSTMTFGNTSTPSMASSEISHRGPAAALVPSHPGSDGEIGHYVFTELSKTEIEKYVDDFGSLEKSLDTSRLAIFVNGMGNSGQDHATSARVLSLVQLCPVVGVYNRTEGFGADLWQCLKDKLKFQADHLGDVKKSFDAYVGNVGPGTRVAKMKELLRTGRLGNVATAALFELLAIGEGANKNFPIFAHSQGNLILSNALQALEIALGKEAIRNRKVLSFGSPTVIWPDGIDFKAHAFTLDLVALLDPVPSWSISKVGWPEGELNPITHGFLYYLQEDAAFIINRHRVGPKWITVSMDEAGLAEELVSFGWNEPRLLRVFRRLDRHFNSDADDVAMEYVQRMRDSNPTVLAKMPKLVELLIQLLDSGITFASEQKVIDYLRSLSG